MYWSSYDTAILLTGIFTLVLAAIPETALQSRTRLAIGGVGATLVVASMITGNQPSGIYPSGVFIAPALPVVAGIALVVRRQRERAQVEQSHANAAAVAAPFSAEAPNPNTEAASDPNTPLDKLADLAYDHPELRSTIAENPSTYPDLLSWLAESGDPAVSAALARRNGR